MYNLQTLQESKITAFWTVLKVLDTKAHKSFIIDSYPEKMIIKAKKGYYDNIKKGSIIKATGDFYYNHGKAWIHFTHEYLEDWKQKEYWKIENIKS